MKVLCQEVPVAVASDWSELQECENEKAVVVADCCGCVAG